MISRITKYDVVAILAVLVAMLPPYISITMLSMLVVFTWWTQRKGRNALPSALPEPPESLRA